jgi:hypothetical protein
VQDAVENVFLPATLVLVAKRILRFYKKIFHENKEGMYKFLREMSIAVCCFLSTDYRRERRSARVEDGGVEADKALRRVTALLPAPAVERVPGDDVQAYTYCEFSDAIILASPWETRVQCLERGLRAVSGRQMKRAGVCKLLVKALALFVSEEDRAAVARRSSKKRRPSTSSSDPLSFFNAAADTFTKGLLSGLQETGLGLFGDKPATAGGMQDASSVPFPDRPDGDCVESLCEGIRLVCEVSVLCRLHVFEERICGVCNSLLAGSYASRAEILYLYILHAIRVDLQCMKGLPVPVEQAAGQPPSISDTRALRLHLSLKVLDQGDALLKSSSKRVEAAAIDLLSAALACIAHTVARYGAPGDQLLREMDGYRVVFAATTHKFTSSFRLAEAWLGMCTNVALASVEAKETLGGHGACDVCMTALRVHSLRPKIVQCR